MKKLIKLKHHFDDYECMWNGIEDIYMDKTGEQLPEGFFFSLAKFGTFCYLKTPKAERKRMVALGDGRTKKMYEFLAPIIGFEYRHYEYKTFEKALKRAKSEIDGGYPVVLGALDMFYLPYFEKLYQKDHIPFHYVLMVGYDEEEQRIYLHDCGKPELVALSYEDLQKAMDCHYPGLSKENTLCTIRMTEPKGMTQIAREALSEKKALFLNPPAGFLGNKGFQKFIRELPHWKKEIGKDEYDRILLNMVEFFGTVPTIPNGIKGIEAPDFIEFKGGFDIASQILRTMGEKTKEAHWEKAAAFFDEGGTIVEKISAVIIEYLSGKQDRTESLPELFTAVLEKIVSGYQELEL